MPESPPIYVVVPDSTFDDGTRERRDSDRERPLHLLLVDVQVHGRQPFGAYDPDAEPIGVESLGPPPEEAGWNDVVTAKPGEVTHVAVHVGAVEGPVTDQPGW